MNATHPAHSSPPPLPFGPRSHTRADEHTRAIRAEQVDLLFSHAPFALALALVNACILVVAERDVVAHSTLALWFTFLLGVSTIRIWWFRQYRQRVPDGSDTTEWERQFYLGALLSGLAWGASGIWLLPSDSPVHQVFVTFILAGMTAGAVMSFSARREAFLAYAIPTLLPVIISLFHQGTKISVAMGLMTCLFAVLALTIAERMHRTIRASIQLRHDNQQLITDLTNQVAQRRQAENTLQQTYDDLELRVRQRTEELAQANLALRAEVEERQRMGQALQESVERFNRAVQGSQEGLWDAKWTTADWFNPSNPVYFSPRFKALLGYEDGEFANQMGCWMSHVHSEDRTELLTTLRHHLEVRAPFDVEFRMVTKTGETRWFVARGKAIWNEAGQPIHMSGSLRDITEHKDLEEKLLQSQKLEAVGRLAAGVAHDFNNLLTPILGYADVLLAKAPAGSTEARRLGDIRRAALHGATLVRQLLAFGRKQPVTPRVLDLNSELATSEELLRRTLGEDIELLFDLAPDLGRIKLDPTQLQQVILNLAANARDAMAEGGCLAITTRPVLIDNDQGDTPPGRYVRLSVADTGSGMPPDVLSHAFEPFFTTKEVGQGSGLGLSVVEGIIGQANGKITATSQVGVGTTFHILLPEIEGVVLSQPHIAPAAQTGTGTVLVVEDNTVVREFTTHVLGDLGYQILVAKNGQEALDLAARHHGSIDLLVTDVVMPGISGIELARRLETSRPTLRVLYVSGHQEDRLAKRVGNRPPAPLLSKPFTPEELSRKVRELLAGQQTHS